METIKKEFDWKHHLNDHLVSLEVGWKEDWNGQCIFKELDFSAMWKQATEDGLVQGLDEWNFIDSFDSDIHQRSTEKGFYFLGLKFLYHVSTYDKVYGAWKERRVEQIEEAATKQRVGQMVNELQKQYQRVQRAPAEKEQAEEKIPAEEPSEKVAGKPSEKSRAPEEEKPAKEDILAKEPVEKSRAPKGEKPAEEEIPAEEPSEKSAGEPFEKSAEVSSEKSVEKPSEELVENLPKVLAENTSIDVVVEPSEELVEEPSEELAKEMKDTEENNKWQRDDMSEGNNKEAIDNSSKSLSLQFGQLDIQSPSNKVLNVEVEDQGQAVHSEANKRESPSDFGDNDANDKDPAIFRSKNVAEEEKGDDDDDGDDITSAPNTDSEEKDVEEDDDDVDDDDPAIFQYKKVAAEEEEEEEDDDDDDDGDYIPSASSMDSEEKDVEEDQKFLALHRNKPRPTQANGSMQPLPEVNCSTSRKLKSRRQLPTKANRSVKPLTVAFSIPDEGRKTWRLPNWDQNWSKVDLKAACRAHKLGVSGNKTALLERLYNFKAAW